MATKRTNYILIDYENVSSLEFGEMAGHPVKVLIFVGENQKRLSVNDVEKMLQHKERVELIRMIGTGHNALDFHIAYYAGRISVEDPSAYIHIISKDQGFDPLIAHLQARHIFVRRSDKVGDIEILNAPDASKLSLDQRLKRVVEHLQAAPQSRPRKRKTLTSSIHALFGKQLTDVEAGAIIEELVRTRMLEIQGNDSISYRL
jgi:hypothetical protein